MSRHWMQRVYETVQEGEWYRKYKRWVPFQDMSWAEAVSRSFHTYLEPGYHKSHEPDSESHMDDVKEGSIPYYAGIMAAGRIQEWLKAREYYAVDTEQRMPMQLNKRVPSYQTDRGDHQILSSLMFDDDDFPYMYLELRRNYNMQHYWYLPLQPHPDYGEDNNNLITQNDIQSQTSNQIVPPGSLPKREGWADNFNSRKDRINWREWNKQWALDTANWMYTAWINLVTDVESKTRVRRRSAPLDI